MKKIIPSIVVFILLVGGILLVSKILGDKELAKFDKNGLYKSANIQKLYTKKELQPGVKSRLTTNYYADVSFFVKESDSRDPNKVYKEKVKQNSKTKSLDEILEDIDNIKVNIDLGEYQSATVKLSQQEFEQLQGQKKIEILYLKSNPEKVIPKSRIN